MQLRNPHALPSPAAPLAALLLSLCVACSSSNPEPPFVAGTIDSMGGTLEVPVGNQMGTMLVVPPDALSEPTYISLGRGFTSPVPGTLPLGLALSLQPSDIDFRVPATLTLPTTADPTGSGQLTMLKRRADGSLVELSPVLRDTMNGTATASIHTFSTVWPAERTFGGLTTQPYLPLASGNVWNFEQDLVITTEGITDAPNLDGTFVTRLLFSTPDADFGFYVQEDFELGVVALSEFSTLGDDSFQDLHDPMPLLQSAVTLGRDVESVWTNTRYTPFGATDPTSSGRTIQLVNATKPREIETPAGTFEDLLLLRIEQTLLDTDGTERTRSWQFTLASEIGFVAVQALDLDVKVVSGTVNGGPIGNSGD